jgi:hypothetical protein
VLGEARVGEPGVTAALDRKVIDVAAVRAEDCGLVLDSVLTGALLDEGVKETVRQVVSDVVSHP